MMSQSSMPFHAIYNEVLAEMEPILRAEARNFRRSLSRGLPVGLDDIIQEGRIALLAALPQYDYDKSHGGLRAFVRQSVRNAFCGLNYAANAQKRQPRGTVYDQDGVPRTVRLPVDSLDAPEAMDPEDVQTADPERSAIVSEMEQRIQVLRLRLLTGLDDREREVFECQAMPSDEFLAWVRDNDFGRVTVEVIGKYLGKTKNEVDWSVKKIKGLLTSIVEEPEYIDLLDGRDHGGNWPMVFLSAAAYDLEFLTALIEQRRLEMNSEGDAVDTSPDGAFRSIQNYSWGSIIHLYLDQERQATLLIEGRFNHRTGEVIGASGHWKRVSQYVPWYGELCKRLSSVRSEEMVER